MTLLAPAVAVMAIGNAGGRICAGLLSDKIGRRWTLLLVLLFQAALMIVAIPVTNSTEDIFLDWGDTETFSLKLGRGECAA